MAEREQMGQSAKTWTSPVTVLSFVIINKLLSEWLVDPVATGAAVLIVFPLTYPFEVRKYSFVRWVLFSCLIAVLLPGVLYGADYLLPQNNWASVVYGLLVGALFLLMRYISIGMHGEVLGSLKGWAMTSLLAGIVAGFSFRFLS